MRDMFAFGKRVFVFVENMMSVGVCKGANEYPVCYPYTVQASDRTAAISHIRHKNPAKRKSR